MLPKTLLKTVQLLGLLLAIATALMFVTDLREPWAQAVGFAIVVGVAAILWSKLNLRDYFFGD